MQNFNFRFVRLLFMAAVFIMSACSKVGGGQLSSPQFIQAEELLDSPYTLAFSWLGVENADSYEYSLFSSDDEKTPIASGQTAETGVLFVAEGELQLYSGVKYTLTLQAFSSDPAYTPSGQVSASLKTSSGPFTLSMTNLTYRSADFKVVPSDNSMLYQSAVIESSKYKKYKTDLEFIEDYDFGYYKHIKEVWSIPMPWYEYMKSCSEQKVKTFTSKSLSTGTEYIFYAYKTEYTGDEANPVKVSGFTKRLFVAPEWRPQSSCSFSASVESQTMLQGSREVDVHLKVTPSSATDNYMVIFYPKSSTDMGKPFNTASNLVRNYELLHGINNWDESGYTRKGSATVSSVAVALADQSHVYAGGDYVAMVFGLDKNGIITTEVKTLEFKAISK